MLIFLRFVALSATIPNIDDLGTWLDVPQDCRLLFGEECRPVKVQTIFLFAKLIK